MVEINRVGTQSAVRAVDFYKVFLAVQTAVNSNRRKSTDELADILNELLLQLGLDARKYSQGETQAVRGVTQDSHSMVQVVLATDRVIYTGYNEGQYNLNQQSIWEPRVDGTKYWASINRNSMF